MAFILFVTDDENAKVKLYSPSSQALLRFVFKFGIEVSPLPRNNCDSISAE